MIDIQDIQQSYPPMTDRGRMIAFMAARQLDHRTLARIMKWSPTYIYGALGGAWQFGTSFRRAFAQTFGDEAAAQVFAQETPA